MTAQPPITVTRIHDRNRIGLFVECRPCGERWEVGKLPVPVSVLVKRQPYRCPNCGERKALYLCPTHGAKAVTGPRRGRAMDAVRRIDEGKGKE